MYKRSRSTKGRRRKGGSKRRKTGPFQYGPVGGVRPGRFGTTQLSNRAPNASSDRAFIRVTKTFIANLGTGAAGAFVLNGTLKCNSAADPSGSFSTGPSVGVVQWLGASPSMYGAYIVHAFRINIQAMSGGAPSIVMGLSLRPNSMAAPTSQTQQAGLPRAQVKLVNTATPTFFGGYYTTAQIYGQSPVTVATADSFSALYNADPGSEVVADITSSDAYGTTLLACLCVIKLTQYIECFGRNTVS